MPGRLVHALYLPHDPFRPIGTSKVRRVDEYRRNAVGGVSPLLMNDPGLVVWNIRHAGVFHHRSLCVGQREIRVPHAARAAVVDRERFLVEEGNAVSVKQPPDLGLAARPIWRFQGAQAVFQANSVDIQPWLTWCASSANCLTSLASFCSERSMILKSLAL